MNETYLKSINEFIEQDVIAVVGYSSTEKQPSNFIYDKFRENGNKVYAVNPNHDKIKDVQCYPDLKSIPEPVGGVMLTTAPDRALDVVKECKELGIKKVWMHRSFGHGSFSEEAVRFCKDNDINCIAGGCPMMFIKADPGHKMFKHIFNWLGRMKTEEAF